MILSISILCILVVLNFYGIYTNRFYFLKPDNYIFPILAIVHFVYLYAIQFKIKEAEVPDISMRNLEYALYFIICVYLFKLMDSLNNLLSYPIYKDHLLPEPFKFMSVLIVYLYFMLLVTTVFCFLHRKKQVGAYKFNDLNEHIDSL